MFTKISSLSLAILLFLVIIASHSNPYVFAVSIFVLLLATFALNFRRLNFTWPHLLLPSIYILAVASVYIIVERPMLRSIFLVFATVVFYFLEIKLGKESHFLQNVFLFSVFALYFGSFAIPFYYQVSFYWILPLIFAQSYIFAVQGLAGFSLPAKKYFYILIALICSEAALGLTLWPTHFLVDAVVLFCLFYILWLFAFSAFFGKLSRQKIYLQLSLIGIVLLMTLSTAAWRPLK